MLRMLPIAFFIGWETFITSLEGVRGPLRTLSVYCSSAIMSTVECKI
jgi:hypothetical protein